MYDGLLISVLQKAGIDYILLECRPAFDVAVGASIALSPNGARVPLLLDSSSWR